MREFFRGFVARPVAAQAGVTRARRAGLWPHVRPHVPPGAGPGRARCHLRSARAPHPGTRFPLRRARLAPAVPQGREPALEQRPGAAPAPGVPTPPPRGGRNSCAQPVGLRLPSPALGLQELVLKHPLGLKPRGPSARRPSRAWENVAVHGTRHREPSPPPRGPRGALGPLPPAWLHPHDA